MKDELTLEKLKQIICEVTEIPVEDYNEENTLEKIFSTLDDDMVMIDLYHLGNIVERVEEDYGVKIRYSDTWLQYPAKRWVSHINRMVRENRIIESGTIGWQTLQQYYKNIHYTNIPESALTGSVKDFKQCILDEGLSFDNASLSDVLFAVIDRFYLPFSDIDLEFFNKKRSMSKVYEELTAKLRSRKKNDCQVYYGKCWSLKSRTETLASLQDFPGYPIGTFMKHIDGKYGVIATENIIVDGERPMPLAGMFCVKDRESNMLYEYDSKENMIDDGWVMD